MPETRLLDPQTRLVGFLGCLVFNMTAGAALLGWIEPAESTAPLHVASNPSQIQLIAIPPGTNPAVAADRWTRIRIERVRAGAVEQHRHRSTLAARPGKELFHFYVDQTGVVTRTRAWHRQTPTADGRDAIRVGLVATPVGETLTEPQWQALLGLVDALCLQCRILPHHVTLDATAGDRSALESAEARLRRHLLAARPFSGS